MIDGQEPDPAALADKSGRGRVITCFELPGFGDGIATVNGEPADQAFAPAGLGEVGRIPPQSWNPGAAAGTARCFPNGGAEDVILRHRASPQDMGPCAAELKRGLAGKGL